MAPAALGRLLGGGGGGGGRSGARSDRAVRKGLGHGKTPRSLRRQDPTRPCPMVKLPEDLILYIFDLVQAASPQSAAKVALVHPRFYHQARYVQHRRVAIDLDNRHEAAAKRLDLIEKDDLLAAIQELHVRSRFGNPDAQCLRRLSGMVVGMTGLRSVHWEYSPIPAAVLESLPKMSFPIRLHVVVRDKNGRNPAARHLLAALAGCGALVSITLDAAYFEATDCLELSRPLKQLLLTCPNLVNLSVDLHLPRQGCVGYAPPFEYPGFGFCDGERPLRPLESLTIHEYPWGEDAQSGFAFHSQGYPCPGQEMDYWATNFDWSALERLEATSPSTQVLLASSLAPKLAALREVRFTEPQDPRGNLLKPFFDRVPSALEAISVPSLDSIGVAAFARHAPTLRRLTLHQPESSSSFHPTAWAEHLLSEGALGDLRERAPRLEDLGIDMLRVGGDWPHAKLDALARFPRLRVLELRFGFGDWRALSGPPQPALTASSAARLFTGLRRARPTLRELRVHSGCWPPPTPGIGLPADSSSYTEDNAVSFVCRVSDRDDDEAVAGGVDVVSLRLSPRLNMRLQRILKGDEKREDVQGNLIALRVALDGPLQYADWERWKKEWPMPYLPALMDAAEGRGRDGESNRLSRSRLSRIWRR